MSLTEDQKKAVRAPGSVAVVAGAGTGKTHMLAERYLHYLTAEGCSPLEVVAVTFTERAADELRGRIREKVRVTPTSGAGSLAELEAAQIGTIHALCARICREHPEEAAVPADFGVLDDAGGRIWAADALADALDGLPAEHYDAMPYDLMRTVLAELVADPIAAERALRRGTEVWERLAAEVRKEALEGFFGDPAVGVARRVLEAHRGPDGDAIEHARVATLSLLDGLQNGGDPGPLFEAFGTIGLRGGSKKKWGEAELTLVKEAVKTVRDIAGKTLKRGMVTLKVGSADDRLAEVLPVLREAFGSACDHLAAAKRRARVLDFAGLEVHALRALERLEVRRFYRERWRAILVDEFQDTNPVQAELLERLAADATSLTVVGDEKQAIYGFRRADAAVFRRFRDRIVAEGGSEVVLARTFRAHGELTETVNTVFSAVLGDLHQALDAHRTDPPHAGPHVRAYAMGAEGKVSKGLRQRAEAAFVSRLLRGIIDEGVLVHDSHSGELRPVRPGDVALLSRAWEPLGVYGEALAAAGVPAVHAGGGDLLETREAKDGIALLRFLDDPTDDVALVALLRGPFFATNDRALHAIALGLEKRSSWWEAVRGVTDGEFLHAREVLEELLRARRVEPPSALLGLADLLTGYTAVITNLPGADRREADWRGFVDLVRELERGPGDLFSVVRSLRRLGEAGVEMPRPPLEARAAVAMMTVHAAKGLEWPMVVIPDLARVLPWNLSPVLFDPDLGVAVDLGGEDGKGVLYRVLAERKRRAEEAEARRVFYVAPTRARDRLILTSTHEVAGGVCGLGLLAPGLALAGIDCETVPFSQEDAVPPELPIPTPGEPPVLLLGPVG